MNKVLVFILMIQVNLCLSQKKDNKLNNIDMYLKEYNSDFQKLDTSVLTRISSESKTEPTVLDKRLNFSFKNKNFLLSQTGREYYRYEERDRIYNTITFEITIDLINSNINTREKLDEIFYLVESYYLNGNIRSKNISSWLGFGINKGFKYDKEGNLIETINYDEGYEFNYEKVLEFCDKNNIDILSNRGPSRNTILKVTLENVRKVWVINYHNIKTNKIDTYQLDGRTGEVIQKWLDQEVYGIKHY